MKKVYISPRIMVENINISLLFQTSDVRVNTNERKSLDAKGYWGEFEDEEEY